MIPYLSLIFLVFISAVSRADWDYTAGLDLGTMSYWSNATAEVGYGVLLWGEDPLKSIAKDGFVNPDDYPWKFGYIRPHLKVESSLTRNAFTGELDFSPISWIILSVGKSVEQRSDNGRLEYNCLLASCSGQLDKTSFTLGGFPMSIGRFFLGGFTRWETIQSVNQPKERDFVDQLSGLVGKTFEDKLKTDVLLAGIVLSKNYLLGGGYLTQAFEKSDESSRTSFGSVTYYSGTISVTTAVGERKRSSQQNEEEKSQAKVSNGFLGILLFTASSTLMDLPTAFPYFAATEILAKMHLAFMLKILVLLSYNIIYIAPLVCIWWLSRKLDNERFFKMIKTGVVFFNKKILPPVVILLGLGLVGYGAEKLFF